MNILLDSLLSCHLEKDYYDPSMPINMTFQVMWNVAFILQGVQTQKWKIKILKYIDFYYFTQN